MSETNVVDKVVDNKLLILLQRVVLLMLPFVIAGAIGYFNSQAGAFDELTKTVNTIANRVDILEERGPLISARRDEQLETLQKQVDSLSSQVEKTTTQNMQILQSLARLEVIATRE